MGVQLDPSCESIKVMAQLGYFFDNTMADLTVHILTLNILIFMLENIVLLQMS